MWEESGSATSVLYSMRVIFTNIPCPNPKIEGKKKREIKPQLILNMLFGSVKGLRKKLCANDWNHVLSNSGTWLVWGKYLYIICSRDKCRFVLTLMFSSWRLFCPFGYHWKES